MNQIVSPADALTFLLAGNATITLESKSTGAHLTFKVRRPKGVAVHFVSLLSGPDNNSDYTFLGTIFPEGFVHSRKSRVSEQAPSVRGFAWFYSALKAGRIPETVRVYHSGRCGRCGRVLTVPESISSGLGPECRGKV